MGGQEEPEEGYGEEESPTRKKIKRFLLNEELRENKGDRRSNYGTKPPGPRVNKFQKVEVRKGQKRPRERESQNRFHLDRRDSRSPMPKIPKCISTAPTMPIISIAMLILQLWMN